MIGNLLSKMLTNAIGQSITKSIVAQRTIRGFARGADDAADPRKQWGYIAQQQDQKSAGAARAMTMLTAAIMGNVGAMLALPKAIQMFGNSVVEANRKLVAFSPTIAAAIAQLDAARIGREVDLARSTAGSASRQAYLQNELEKQQQPYSEMWNEAWNRVSGSFSEVGAEALKDFHNTNFGKRTLEWFEEMKQASGNANPPASSLDQFADELAREYDRKLQENQAQQREQRWVQ